jgi:hypothetical protein
LAKCKSLRSFETTKGKRPAGVLVCFHRPLAPEMNSYHLCLVPLRVQSKLFATQLGCCTAQGKRFASQNHSKIESKSVVLKTSAQPMVRDIASPVPFPFWIRCDYPSATAPQHTFNVHNNWLPSSDCTTGCGCVHTSAQLAHPNTALMPLRQPGRQCPTPEIEAISSGC